MTYDKRLVGLCWMGIGFLIVLAGALWDGLHGDWAWRHWLLPAVILASAEILRRQPRR